MITPFRTEVVKLLQECRLRLAPIHTDDEGDSGISSAEARGESSGESSGECTNDPRGSFEDPPRGSFASGESSETAEKRCRCDPRARSRCFPAPCQFGCLLWSHLVPAASLVTPRARRLLGHTPCLPPHRASVVAPCYVFSCPRGHTSYSSLLKSIWQVQTRH